MNIEYEQKFKGWDLSKPTLKVIEKNGEKPQYLYGNEIIDQKRFQELFENLKRNDAPSEWKKIVVLDDAGNQISNIDYYNGDNNLRLDAQVKVGNGNFEYCQLIGKTSKLQVKGQLVTRYMNFKYGEQESEYIDKQPRLDDPLLDKRDEILDPYFQIMNGKISVAEFCKTQKSIETENNQENGISELPTDQTNQALFDYIINGIKSGEIKPAICAKSVAVDARQVKPEEVGQKHTVYSHGKVEKEITLAEDTVLLTTLDTQGNPVIDEKGNTNTYDMKLAKFLKTYPKQVKGGHFVKDPYALGSVMVAVKVPENVIADGITMLPPGWGGYEGTLMPGGIVMFPFDPKLNLKDQVKAWEAQGANKLDWYPNNEANTYSRCDKNGTFEDENLRNLFEQDKIFENTPYQYQDKIINGPEMGM